MDGTDDELMLGGLELPIPALVVEGGAVVAASSSACRLAPDGAPTGPLVDWFEEADAPVIDDVLARPQDRPSFAQLRHRDRWVELHVAASDVDGRRVVLLREATDEQFVRSSVDAVADSTFVIDAAGGNRWRSEQLRERSGVPDSVAAQTPAGERIHPEDLPTVFEAFAAVTVDHPLTVTVRSRAVDDDDRWETIDIVVWNRLEHPVFQGYLVQVHNLDEGRTITTALSEADPQLLSLTDAAPVGIAVTDPAGQVVYRNPVARALLGPDVRSFAGTEWVDLARPEHRAKLAAAVEDGMHDDVESEVIAAFGPDDEDPLWLRVRIVPQRAHIGAERTMGIIATIEDVTESVLARRELEATQDQLRHLATHDPLTGLPNRTALMRELERAVARHERDESGVAVLFCDLDGFKPVNDQQGHAGGDAVLQALAGRLEAAVREVDLVARLGGDEFVVLCEGVAADDDIVRAVADRLHESVRVPITVSTGAAEVGFSIGIAVSGPGNRATASALLVLADQAMYEAKAAGGRATVVRHA